MIRAVNASFVISAPSIREAPPEGLSEVAFLGRSNVGKSSLLNSLSDRKNLAKKSSTPGKTRLINFFDIVYKTDEAEYPLRFIDLPGFGYAKASKTLQKEWKKSLTEFIKKRASIRVFVLLRDARHPNLEIDEEAKRFIKSFLRPDQALVEVFTKVDKLKQSELAKLKREFPNAVYVSNTKKRGIEELKKIVLEKIFGTVK
ncbi:ribosome biogenesis GTP-binding protein YihA/YsxC [Nitrosophilus alvini]|uniref:ribosome biogenesis GTP-binding protein YihA/YsxC n=1 Tax=Nitrosophilus alvini TaxID=2714855 RepID=UPI00190B9BC5|nr:ribosome biogenesis GTP-binding protein YihA/YsxC [Nitrosophilus alvini]